MRKLVIGDIHAGVRALKQLLERAEVTPEDQLIFLGDYVDAWSEAVETVDFLLGLQKTHNCTFIKGNHDELCYEWLTTGQDNHTWLQHGGSATKASYQNTDAATIERHLKFYENLELYQLDDKNRLFLHAGFTNLKGVEHEYFTKSLYWDRTLWELALSVNPQLGPDHFLYPKRLLQYHEIFIGHTPVTRIGETTPQKAVNVWNVDTGAAFNGPLTMMDVDTKQFWQSDPVFLLYPGEKGRN